MKKVFIIDGGAGRAITAIPALEKYIKSHPEEDTKIFIAGWDSLFWSNKILQDHTFNLDDKGVFDNHIKYADEVIRPEPYILPEYFKQKVSLIEAFDIIINGDNSKLLKPNLYLSNSEKNFGLKIIDDVKKYQKKEKTIVVQPYGSTARFESIPGNDDVIDDSNRSFTLLMYSFLVKKLSEKYNIILFSDKQFHFEEDNFSYKLNADLRTHMSAIDAADYFVGCDSVGQHMARAFDKPGTIIFGSTFPENVSYPNWFNIIDKNKESRVYSPLRISMIDCKMADRINNDCMDYSIKDLETIYSLIVKDIEKKVG